MGRGIYTTMLVKNTKIWTTENSSLLKYKALIDSGQILVGQELYLELKNLEDDLLHNDEYYYNTDSANLRMHFMAHCVRLTKSPYYGKPMVLMEWQKAFIETLYSFKMAKESKDRGMEIDRFKKALLLIARKNTKALALNTRIPTPSGDKTIEEIQAGDFVFGVDGKPIKVLETSEIFRDRKCLEFTFEDGEKIICDENHKWTVQTKEARRMNQYVPISNRKSRSKHKPNEKGEIVIQAFEMVNDFKRGRKDGKGMEYKYRVPIPEPLEYPDSVLPIDPYVLGIWLGDGDKNDNRIAVGVDDLETLKAEMQKREINIASINYYNGKYEMRLGNKVTYHQNDFRTALKECGVYKNKHIPEEYFTASISQRYELLKGLMDTDGTATKSGQCVFSQKSERIVKDLSRLLSSLGIKHTISYDQNIRCGDKICAAYKIQFWVDKAHTCFCYQRKTDRLKDHLAPRMNYKSIINIREVENRDTKCITVDSQDGLFICGERNTVTHNSETCSAIANAEFILGNEGSDLVCSSNDDAQASIVYDAIDAMRRLYDPNDLDTKRNQRFILNKTNQTKIFKLSDRTRNKEGRNIDFGILDEVHEMQTNTIAKSIEQSQSLKDNPKFIEITTEGFVTDGYLDEEMKFARSIVYGEDDSVAALRFLPWLYTQDSEQEIFTDPRTWQKSNPSLGIVKKVQYLEEQIDLAKKSKANRIFVLAKDFNIKQNEVESWLNIEDYTYNAKFDIESFRGSYCLGHVDLAETTDLCCAKALLMKPNDRTKYIITMYFIPQSKLELENDDHNAGAKYKEWAQKGYITICEGNDIDLTIVADWFYKLHKEYGIQLYKCGYDQRFAKEWLKRMEDYGWTKQYEDVEMILQNAQTLNNALYLVESDLKAQLINYNENPVDRWCFSNSCLKVNDLRQALCVKTEKAKKIDGSVTLISLYEMYRRHRSELKKLVGGE